MAQRIGFFLYIITRLGQYQYRRQSYQDLSQTSTDVSGRIGQSIGCIRRIQETGRTGGVSGILSLECSLRSCGDNNPLIIIVHLRRRWYQYILIPSRFICHQATTVGWCGKSKSLKIGKGGNKLKKTLTCDIRQASRDLHRTRVTDSVGKRNVVSRTRGLCSSTRAVTQPCPNNIHFHYLIRPGHYQ